MKIFFQIMLNKVLQKVVKLCSKATEQETKELVAGSYNFSTIEVPSAKT